MHLNIIFTIFKVQGEQNVIQDPGIKSRIDQNIFPMRAENAAESAVVLHWMNSSSTPQ
jgi:hypothetical protein